MRDGGRTLGAGDEVGQAGKDHHGGLLPDLGQSLGKDAEVAALENLCRLELGIGTDTSLVHVAGDVGVAKKGEDSGHRGDLEQLEDG